MLSNLIYAGVVFMGFFSIMNPITGISIFLALTSKEKGEEVKKTAITAVITAFTIVVTFALAGHFLLNFLGVSFTALRLAGGILVALIGYEMLQAKQSTFNNPASESLHKGVKEEGSIAVTPLGIPLLAGPGVIITAMNFASGSFMNLLITVSSFGILCIITYFAFISGKKIKAILGADTMKVITRMMGLVLVVIGTQMLIEGIYAAVQGYQTLKYF